MGITGLLCLLTGQTEGKQRLSRASVMGRRVTLRARCPGRDLGCLPSQGDWQGGTPPSSMISFQRVGSRSLRNTVLGIKLARGFFKKDLHFKGTKKDLTIIHFSKVNPLRKGSQGTSVVRPSDSVRAWVKGRSGARRQGEACLKCLSGGNCQGHLDHQFFSS